MATELPKAIIFDMDDTILSDDKSAENCWRQVCHEMFHRIQSHAVGAVGSPDGLTDTIQDLRRWYWADPRESGRAV